jgi:hypothetical protein
MKVLLQDLDTHLFLKGLTSWTDDPSEALDFQDTSRAIEFWNDNDLLKVQVVLKYNDTKDDVVFAVLPDRQRSNTRHQA